MTFKQSIIMLFLLIGVAFAVIPTAITIHGKLTNANNVAQVSKTVNMTFAIYNVSSGGTALYTSSNANITTDYSGVYSYQLTGLALPFDVNYFLGVTIANDSEMTPRINITSNGYAYRANISDSLSSSGNYTVAIMNATTFYGNLNASYVQNSPWITTTAANAQYLNDTTSANTYISVSGDRNKSLSFNETVLNSTIGALVAAATPTFTPNSTTNATGILNPCNITNVWYANDGSSCEINETAGTPGFDWRFNFTQQTHNFNLIEFNVNYSGTAGHDIEAELFNYNTSSWDTFNCPVVHGSDYVPVSCNIFNSSVYLNSSSNITQFRFYHVNSGISSHRMWVDYLVFVSSTGTVNSLVGSGTAGTVPKFITSTSIGDSPMTISGNNVTVSGNVTANTFFGALAWASITGAPGFLGAAENTTINALVSSNNTTNSRIDSVNSTATGKASPGTASCAGGSAAQNVTTTTTGTTSQCVALPTGTITSISANASGLLGGTITSSGSIALNDTYVSSVLMNNGSISRNATSSSCAYGISQFSHNGSTITATCASQQGTVTSVGTSSPITGGTITGTGTIGIQVANSSQNGYLASSDWTTFNNKGTGNGTVTSVTCNGGLTGGAITGSGTCALNTTGATAGTYGNATVSATLTIDSTGRVTAISNNTIAASAAPTTWTNMTAASNTSNWLANNGTCIMIKGSTGTFNFC